MSLYSEAAFKGAVVRGGLGFADAGLRNSALEAWAHENDQRLIAEARERNLTDEAALATTAVSAEVVTDFASVEVPAPAVFAFPTAEIL